MTWFSSRSFQTPDDPFSEGQPAILVAQQVKNLGMMLWTVGIASPLVTLSLYMREGLSLLTLAGLGLSAANWIGIVAYRRGHARWTAQILTPVYLIGSLLAIAAHGSLRSANVLILLAALVAAGSYLPRRALVFWTIVSVVSLAGLTALEHQGVLPKPNLEPSWTVWVTQAAVMISLVVSVFSARNRTEVAFATQEKAMLDLQMAHSMLEESQQHFQALFRSSPAASAVHEYDGHQAVLDVNHAFVTMFGLTCADLKEQGSDQLWVNKKHLGRFRELLLEQGRVLGFRTTGRRGDGSLFEVSVFAELVLDKGRRLLISMVVDVSAENNERLRLEQHVAARTAQLQYLNQELDAFAYSVSHDLKSPLRAMNGLMTVLHDQMMDRMTSSDESLIERVLKSVSRMNDLINDLLSLARVSQAQIERQPVDLSAMVLGVLNSLKQVEPARDVQMVVAPGLKANCDPRLALVVVENLVGNAWKYSRERATARIEFGVHEEDEVDASSEHRLLYIRDNGAGFDMARSERLFKPFSRLHSPKEFEGSGIGLATVRRVIERHDGSLRAEGVVGQGATFWFSFGTSTKAAAQRQ